MEGLTRLVSESLARHGFDRPLDYRRLHWSRWFRCESHHSLLLVPSKAGVFALAAEIMDLGSKAGSTNQEGHDVSRADTAVKNVAALAAEELHDGGHKVEPIRRLLAVTRFFEDEDMAFVLDRMLAYENPMRAGLNSGRYFVRFVVIEDGSQRRSICDALNQWIANSSEKASGIGSHFASSLELTPATEYVPRASDVQGSLFESRSAGQLASERESKGLSPATASVTALVSPAAASQLDSGAAANLHCPSPFPSGF
jgi:hypothetical protein